MTQTLTEKAAAIASVLWLMEQHYAMVTAGRVGSCIHYERTPDGTEQWRPPIVEEFEDWPVNRIIAWVQAQRKVSARYRLWAIGMALCRVHARSPQHSLAVRAFYVEIPPVVWLDNVEQLAREGLEFIAEDVPGDVRAWGESRPKTKRELVLDLLGDNLPTKTIAIYAGCDPSYVRRIKRAMSVRSEREMSAVGVAI